MHEAGANGWRWISRALSLASIGVILAFLIGEGIGFLRLSWSEWVLFLFFPFGVVVGLVLGWRWSRLGGLVALASLAAFYGVCYALSRHFPHGWAFAALTSPALLLLADGVIYDR